MPSGAENFLSRLANKSSSKPPKSPAGDGPALDTVSFSSSVGGSPPVGGVTMAYHHNINGGHRALNSSGKMVGNVPVLAPPK